MVEVARGLIARPRVLLLDEPAAGLSAADVERLVAPLTAIAAEERLAVAIIEHDIELVARLCPNVAVLDFGSIIASGPPGEVLALPAVVDAYLGASFAAQSH
jgi:ABC-type branched-subunit amino acid transport system ATPase component